MGRGGLIIAVVATSLVLLIVIAASGSLLKPPAKLVTHCNTKKELVVLRRIKVSDVAWAEFLGMNVTRVCSTYKLIPTNKVCLIENGRQRCIWRYKEVLLNKTVTHHPEDLRRIVVKINMTAYKEVWLKENPGLCAQAICEGNSKCKCLRFIPYRNVTFTVVKTLRRIPTENGWATLILPVPLPTVKGEKQVVDKPTYERHVIVPLIKALTKNKKLQAEIAQAIIKGSGYNASLARFNHGQEGFYAYGGVCVDWAATAYTIGQMLGFRTICVDGEAEVGEPHSSAFLCEPWWKSKYRIKIYYRNGTILTCAMWVDTGWAIANWKNYFIYIYQLPPSVTQIVKVEKYYDDKLIGVYKP